MSLFEEIAEKQLQLQEQIKATGQEALREYYAKFFEDNPTIEAVRWVQYTPYFNDGDPCTFSLSSPEIRFNDGQKKDGWGDDEEDEYGDRYSYGDSPYWYEQMSLYTWDEETKHLPWAERTRTYHPSYEPLQKLERDMNLNEKVFEMIFGDHVQITATREGFQIEEYYHD